MDKVTIRKALVTDVPQLRLMIKALSEFEGFGHSIPDEQTLIEDGFGHHPWYYTIVAEVHFPNGKKELVGHMTYSYMHILRHGRMASIGGFYVKPDYQKFGIGGKLYNQVAKEIFIEEKCVALRFLVKNDNINAIKFYKKRGAESLNETEQLFPMCIFRDAGLKGITGNANSSGNGSATEAK